MSLIRLLAIGLIATCWLLYRLLVLTVVWGGLLGGVIAFLVLIARLFS